LIDVVLNYNQTEKIVFMLNEEQRRTLLDKISGLVVKQFSDVHLKAVDWNSSVARHEATILRADSDEGFEVAIGALLKELKSSHVGFYHTGLKRSSSKMAICATYAAFPFDDSERWVFQDVHEGGPAANAGIRSGDILLSVEGRKFTPPEHPIFPIGQTVKVDLLTMGNQEKSCSVVIPLIKKKFNQLPQVLPSPLVSHRRINHAIGYIKIAAYPGALGIDVANEISDAFKSLNLCNRLIVDLRGNSGGGGAFLRLLSLLTPKRITVGRFSRNGFVRSTDAKKDSFIFDRVPRNKLELYLLIARFGRQWLVRKALKRDIAVTVVTEGTSQQPFHGRVVLLVNRHTASANEMVIAAARESKLAVTVGESTPGRLLQGTDFAVEYGYRLALPAMAYSTSGSDPVEGQPIPPDVAIGFDPAEARAGGDGQLDKAVEIVSQL
jgi:carboxyl-terminal processing protease